MLAHFFCMSNTLWGIAFCRYHREAESLSVCMREVYSSTFQMCGSPSWQRVDKNIHRKSDWACRKSRPTLDMFRIRYSFIKAKRSNGSKVMQRRAKFSKAKQCTVMQNKCLKTGTAWFWRTSVLVYLYFLVVHITELNLLRALSWMAGGFDWHNCRNRASRRGDQLRMYTFVHQYCSLCIILATSSGLCSDLGESLRI